MDRTESLFPASLLAEIEALAASERRNASELIHEALQIYLQDRRPTSRALRSDGHRTSAEAARRMLDRRDRRALPNGMTIRDLMTFGRA